MEKIWRLILDTKHNGYYNMAVDEAILQHYSVQRVPTLRIYGWNEPFISLGYSQAPQTILNDNQEIPFVRRITGGAAILHNDELTYSIICSKEDLDLPKGVKASYRLLCSFLKHFYKELGVRAEFAVNALPELPQRYGNFCFSSFEAYDLLIERRKIGGNAQRRRKNIIFQHGSIPQAIDFEQIKKSIKEVTYIENKATSLNLCLKKATDFSNLALLLANSFCKTFNVELNAQKLQCNEKETCRYLVDNKYAQKKWNFRCNEKTCVAK